MIDREFRRRLWPYDAMREDFLLSGWEHVATRGGPEIGYVEVWSRTVAGLTEWCEAVWFTADGWGRIFRPDPPLILTG